MNIDEKYYTVGTVFKFHFLEIHYHSKKPVIGLFFNITHNVFHCVVLISLISFTDLDN